MILLNYETPVPVRGLRVKNAPGTATGSKNGSVVKNANIYRNSQNVGAAIIVVSHKAAIGKNGRILAQRRRRSTIYKSKSPAHQHVTAMLLSSAVSGKSFIASVMPSK